MQEGDWLARLEQVAQKVESLYQRRYDIAYQQCMYAKGNQLPGYGYRQPAAAPAWCCGKRSLASTNTSAPWPSTWRPAFYTTNGGETGLPHNNASCLAWRQAPSWRPANRRLPRLWSGSGGWRQKIEGIESSQAPCSGG